MFDVSNFQEDDENDDGESEDGDSNDPDENAVENDKNIEINDHKEHDMTTGEESDDEAEEDYSSNRDEGGNDTGGNSEEVVIISFPTSRKRAYSCMFIYFFTYCHAFKQQNDKSFKYLEKKSNTQTNPI